MEATCRLSRRSFLQLLGTSTLSTSALTITGCAELFGPSKPPQRVVGISLARHLVIENSGTSAIRDFRISFSVDFHVGGLAENAFNWVDGYPILQAYLPRQWSWGISTPVDFDLLDTRTPFGLDPDAFSFYDTQGQVGDFSTTFVFRKRTLEPGTSWRIPLLYLAGENDLGLIQIYRRVLPQIELFQMPTSLTPTPHENYITLADQEMKISVQVDGTRLYSPIRSIDGTLDFARPNPIYQEGLGAKYLTSYGELIFVTSENTESGSIQVDPEPLPGALVFARRVCGERLYKQVKWRWCVETPNLWHGV